METGTHRETMTHLSREAAHRFGDGTAAMFLRDGAWQTMTFREMWRRVSELARGLIDLGVGVGDRVAILSNTRVEFTIVELAVNTAGAIAVPVYPLSDRAGDGTGDVPVVDGGLWFGKAIYTDLVKGA